MTEKANKLTAVFDACTQPAPNMTHALSELGNGDMGDGIIAVWQAGQNNGFILGATITTTLFIASIGTYKVISCIREDRRMKKKLRIVSEEMQQRAYAIEAEGHYAY